MGTRGKQGKKERILLSYGAFGADEIVGSDEDELLDMILSGDEDDDDDDDDFGYDEDDDDDDFGADEIIGEELAIGRKARKRSKRAAALRRIRMRGAVGVKGRKFNRKRKYVLGLSSLGVLANGTAQVIAAPQYPFRPFRYIVPSSFSTGFLINAINIGQQPVFVAAGQIPADAFTEVSWGSHVLWDTASIGNQVTVEVNNTNGVVADFRSVMLGIVTKD